MLGAAQQKAPRVLRGWFRLKAAVKVEFERKMEELFRWLRFYAALRCCWVIQPGTQQAMLALKRVPSQTSGKWFCLWFLPYLRNGWAVSHRLTRANISVLRMNHAVEVLNPWYTPVHLLTSLLLHLIQFCLKSVRLWHEPVLFASISSQQCPRKAFGIGLIMFTCCFLFRWSSVSICCKIDSDGKFIEMKGLFSIAEDHIGLSYTFRSWKITTAILSSNTEKYDYVEFRAVLAHKS